MGPVERPKVFGACEGSPWKGGLGGLGSVLPVHGDTGARAVPAPQVTPRRDCEPRKGLPGQQGMEGQGWGVCGSQGVPTGIFTTPKGTNAAGWESSREERFYKPWWAEGRFAFNLFNLFVSLKNYMLKFIFLGC